MSRAKAAFVELAEDLVVPACVILILLFSVAWMSLAWVISGQQELCEPGQLLWTGSRKPPMEIVVDGKLIHVISWSSHDGYMCLDTYQE